MTIPREIGEIGRLRELHIQNNRLTVLPPEIGKLSLKYSKIYFKIFFHLGNLDLTGNKSVLKMEENEWVQPIAEQYLLGISHVLEYIKTDAYRM